MVVEEDSSAYDSSTFCPGADSIVVGLLNAISAVDFIECDAVVEDLLFLVAEVSEAVPLGGGLGVEGPDVVVYDSRWLLVDVLFEGLAAEEGDVGLGVERPVEVHADAGLDFRGGGLDDGVG